MVKCPSVHSILPFLLRLISELFLCDFVNFYFRTGSRYDLNTKLNSDPLIANANPNLWFIDDN